MLSVLKNLLGGRSSEEARLPAFVPEGERVYAIGDIHGRSDLLADLLRKITADTVGYKGRVTLVCIGDYIDRGPDSRGVVEMLLKAVPAGWQKVFIRGNHEQAMIDFMKNPKRRTEWLAWGGLQALESYAVRPYGAKGPRDPETLAEELEYALVENPGHKDFVLNTRLSFTLGDYAFVHAGVRAGVPLEKQMLTDLLFIRDDFFGRPHRLPQRIVFGHTILPEPLVEDDRIGLDTGAFQTGILTAARLEGDRVDLIQAMDDNALKQAEHNEIQEG